MQNDPTPASLPDDTRILLLPPTSRDAEAIGNLLEREGLACAVYSTLRALCDDMTRGAGAVVVSEEAILADPYALAYCVNNQPVWSDLPIIVLSRSGHEKPATAALLSRLGNISVLERPVRLTTFISLVRTALRARERQLQVRDHLADRRRAEEDLRHSEQRLRLAVQTGKLGVWEVDLRTAELTCTPACKANFGRPADAPFTYEDFWAAIHRDDVSATRAAVQRSVREHIEYDIEYRNVWPDGSIHWVLGRGQPSYAEDGTPLRMVGVTLDITERKSIEERRNALLEAERAARAEAERAGRMKDEFLATLSHELRTPLNAIFGWAQILKSGASTAEDVCEAVDVIERNARAQTQIIEDLLDMSRIISGKIRLDVQRVDLAAVIHSAIETVKPAADVKEIRLQTILDPRASLISGDPNRLQQILWNLLSNAVKFTLRGGRIQIVLERVNSSLEVRIADNGAGIEPQFLPFVFDRFRQADATTTRQHGGLGLGLAIVKQLVELHGGLIRASSAGKGHGSTFVVSLPQSAIESEAEPAPPRRHPSATPDTPKTDACVEISGLKILVVDDEPDARALLRRVLEDCDAIVFTSSSAEEAVAELEKQRPDVIVSDIGMPIADGYALIRRVRALPPERGGRTPALALTAYARAEDRVSAMVAGFQHHLSKPVAPNELIAIVASLTGRISGN